MDQKNLINMKFQSYAIDRKALGLHVQSEGNKLISDFLISSDFDDF